MGARSGEHHHTCCRIRMYPISRRRLHERTYGAGTLRGALWVGVHVLFLLWLMLVSERSVLLTSPLGEWLEAGGGKDATGRIP